jgi:hypothetical protein
MKPLRDLSFVATTLVIAASLAGCESTSAVEADYGASVRQIFPAQAHDPAAQASPSTALPPSPDGEMINAAVSAARKDVGARGEVDEPIVISLGGGR